MTRKLCTERMMQCGHDMTKMLNRAPEALVRLDTDGWLGLSGEKGTADLNMAFVARTAPASLLEDYVKTILGRGLNAILIVDEEAPDLVAAGEALGLINVGGVPVMEWSGKPKPMPTHGFTVRKATKGDVRTACEVAARAFSLDNETLQRVGPPELLDDGIDIWLVEDDSEIVGMGQFVRTDDHVGIYVMSTPPEHQRRGIGRAVLDGAMAHYIDAGATTFTLEATEAGYHLYEQVGFEVVATPPVLLIGESTQFPG